MLDDIGIRTDPLPESMRVLLRDYPRDGWDGHPLSAGVFWAVME